jgi:hypothetical protein
MWILVSLSKFRQPAVMLMQLSELLFGPVFEINQSIAGPSHRGKRVRSASAVSPDSPCSAPV